MDRIFWVMCPECKGRFYCDYELRNSKMKLICPFCQKHFYDSESLEIDERANR